MFGHRRCFTDENWLQYSDNDREAKDECKREIQEELNQRVAECLPKLSEDEIVEFEDVQSNPDRTRRWLRNFTATTRRARTTKQCVRRWTATKKR